MPILNMIAQGGGGGNIGEPLNLTVTTSGLDATITWEDNEIGTIPPTTFQKSELVRKIGSAPTSPSDGTLVVTETVKDTYKTTGYVDQGLTDGETYYYRVFSYSDLGGISYCDAVSVGGGWQPGVNTIAYYKISDTDTNTTIYDLSGNGKHLTWAGTPTYQTDGTYGRVAYFNGNSYASLGGYLNPNGTAYTIIALFNGVYDKAVVTQGSSSSRINTIAIYSNGALTCQNPANANNYLGPTSTLSANTWYMVCGVRDGNNFKLYINGTLNNSKTFGSVSVDWASGGYWELGANRHNYDKYTGMIKTVIFENKAWTDTEIANLAKEYGFTVS